MQKKKAANAALTVIMALLSALFLAPIFIVLMNSFKTKFNIISSPFSFPDSDTFAGIQNYINGINSSGIITAFFRSLFITVCSVAVLVICSAMAAWYIVRVKSRFTKLMYYLFVFSMIVPFQMVMYTMTYTVTSLKLNNLIGIIFVYLGFGAGLSVFMMSGFIKSVPLEIEEAAMIDGCSPLQTFFMVVFPILKPTAITVAILNAMWIWNDYLLPYLILGTSQKTMPVAIQLAMQGAYGAVDWGGFMAMLVIAIIPIVIFYLFCQRYIIEGVVAGAVKG
ncbi:MAG: carbohydrate ABC transporter permease [Clostridiales bacterium]|nr:carbohydrate ABC transporter permease [Clostridiales bacterium]